jgi:RNA-directed DNA polymerase
MLRAVRKHTDCKWLLLYTERWLKAPVQLKDGTLVNRDKGSPQGSVISPLLANLFLHYGFDEWMRRHYSMIPFERYADDIIVHCKSEEQVGFIKTEIEKRLSECKLEAHPLKTKIVYCKDSNRKGQYPNKSFDFLGYSFQPRLSKDRWNRYFVNFSPAVSNKAAKSIRETIRSWKVHLMSDKSIIDLSRTFNPVIRGWINYYGKYYKSALYPIFNQLNFALIKWAMRKFKRLRNRQRKAYYWLGRIARKIPNIFAHWRLGAQPSAGR